MSEQPLQQVQPQQNLDQNNDDLIDSKIDQNNADLQNQNDFDPIEDENDINESDSNENNSQNNLQEEQKSENQVEDNNQKLSKNEMKRQKRAEMWESIKKKKKELKKQEKEKKKLERQQQHIENSKNQEEVIQQKQQHKEPYKSNQQLRDEYSNRAKNGQPIILDMQFLDMLEDKEFKSLVKQLCYMQSSNKKAEKPCRFIISSVSPKLRQALNANNADKWGIEILDQHYLDLFPKDNLVYLTGDTDQDLDELDQQCAYIIGGLVDHNRLKNVTLNAATEQGIQVKRFPIQNHLKLEASSILACNHVFDIMVQRANGKSWKESLQTGIPIRKVVALIENGVEIPTEHYLKKLEQMKKQQQIALEKKKLQEQSQEFIKDSQKASTYNEIKETDLKESDIQNESDESSTNKDCI
ncbi:tRNA (guanine(37)-N(1))-methyltransferase (macronuclear) [Tetrahymena thermophila SB210]|uniref:tRNA (guanine(9)-N(1))-methyltransferase n=1 Tax=Tetrahymena thermophila (strain SB210) TaxID=312017 RepID=I7MJ04_TETTS|nr:tRNA (guanine(37)-N(1))-methyltransferase [Tetrahymena thermophila SB210]EAS04902.1 tRNA (guanine(37)-N(1))-methyltransferase [Tetrahymena thermophila SB210]|eukprot:XP_001025147.1 tRNA (guanine(37)-N(1))-methyltransferase [Tetrahymena thermophila SB210]